MNRITTAIAAPLLVALSLGACKQGTVAHAEAPRVVVDKAQSGQFKRPMDAKIKSKLSPLQFRVTQQNGTEPPFQNRFWNNKREGLYVDIVSGEPLFSSRDKFKSGTGWPSFTQPFDPQFATQRSDTTHGMRRVEARSVIADSHLGHVFDDGPAPTGQRWCINSASLRFIPTTELEAEGYAFALPHFLDPATAKATTETPFVASADNAMDPTINACTEPAPGETAGCASNLEVALLAGGCFWGMEDILRGIPGVLDTEVGYTGGHVKDPAYTQVSSGRSGHAESVRVVFDPAVLSYETLLEKWFFRMHDPTTVNRQGNDRGTQYRSAIFYTDDVQRDAARRVKTRVGKSGQWEDPVVTEITPAGPFTTAEDYHQDYLKRSPDGYTCHYLR